MPNELQELPTFADLRFHQTELGIDAKMFFPNGFGVSVVVLDLEIKYGVAEPGKYEVALVYGPADSFEIIDVCKNLSPEQVTLVMQRVASIRTECAGEHDVEIGRLLEHGGYDA